MDTRSVVRSRRRSTRLTGQPPPDERVKRPTAGERRHSDHNTPAKTNSNASREGSCPQMGPTSKKLSSHIVHLETAATDETETVVKTENKDLVPPLFPNLRLSRAKTTQSPRNEADSTTVPLEEPVDTSYEAIVKGHVNRRWVKTARGSIRLASESPAGSTQGNADKREAKEEGQASSAMARRWSRRLASLTPDVADDTVEVEHLASRHTASKIKAIGTTACAPHSAFEEAENEAEPDLQGPSIRAISQHDPITQPTRHEGFLIHDEKPGELPQEPDTLQNTSPIPELVADIERIIQSSPLADRNSVNDGTKSEIISTPTKALRRRASANMGDRGRMLRSSSRSVESISKIGERRGIDQTDSESSQFDGAFDDSIRSRKKKKAQAAGDKKNTSKPVEPRGTKRSARKLSQDEENGDTPGPRQRRKPNGDESKPEEDLRPANPVEMATSRDSIAVDNPDIENPVNTSEFARRSDEPANPVTLAELISTNQERADSDADSMAAECGSQGGASPSQNTHKCADCGRTPERYLVCAKCKQTIYCGKYCQIWNWPLHKTRCLASDEADQDEIEQQEAYLGDMWAAALKVLEDEKTAGGTLESVLLGEAVRHSPTRPWFMGQVRPRGFVAFDVDASRSAPRDSEAVDRARAMSMRLAQAALGSDQ